MRLILRAVLSDREFVRMVEEADAIYMSGGQSGRRAGGQQRAAEVEQYENRDRDECGATAMLLGCENQADLGQVRVLLDVATERERLVLASRRLESLSFLWTSRAHRFLVLVDLVHLRNGYG